MNTIRNWYIYLVSALTASVMAVATISLLRDLTVVDSSPPLAIASKVAALMVALPILVIHARWAQRVAVREEADRPGFVSRLYLTGMAAGYLGVTLGYTYATLNALLRWLFGVGDSGVSLGYGEPELVNGAAVVYYLIPAAIGALVWLVHRQLITRMVAHTMAGSEHVTDGTADDVLLRLSQNLFTAVGLGVFVIGVVQLLTIVLRLLVKVGISAESSFITLAILPEVARIAIGLPLWLIFQHKLRQRTTAYPEPAPQLWPWTQLLNALVLFIAAFIASVSLLWSILELLFGLAKWPDVQADLLFAVATLIVCAMLWLYHDTRLRQFEITPVLTNGLRFYHYMCAGIGLATFLGGMVGLVTILIREVTGATVARTQSLEIVSWAVSAIVVGLPAWLLPWLMLQREAAADTLNQGNARTSRVRQFYLYFYLFVAVMTILGSVIYILTQLVGVLLGEPLTGISAEMAQAIAYSLMAALLFAYHWRSVAADRQFALTQQAEQEQTLVVAVLNELGGTLAPLLRQHLPKANIETVDFDDETAAVTLATATFIVAPAILEAALAGTPAQKLLVPAWSQNVNWVGVEQLDTEQQAKAVAKGVRQLAAGKPMRHRRQFGCFSLIGLVVLLIVLMQIIGVIANLV